MTIGVLLAVGIGIIFGYIFDISFIETNIDTLITIGLILLLFFAGMDMGRNKNVIKEIKEFGYKIFLVPIMIIIGTLFGSFISSFLLEYSPLEVTAVGAGLGWYTLSAIELTKYSTELGTLAFLSNVAREILAILSIPFISKKIGYIESIAPAAATSMDTSLPIISKFTNGSTAIIAFVSGFILTMLVPILVPFIINL